MAQVAQTPTLTRLAKAVGVDPDQLAEQEAQSSLVAWVVKLLRSPCQNNTHIATSARQVKARAAQSFNVSVRGRQ